MNILFGGFYLSNMHARDFFIDQQAGLRKPARTFGAVTG